MANILNLKEIPQEEPIPEQEPTPKKPVKRIKKTKNSPDQIEWTTPEFEHYPKSKSWFLILGLIAIGLFIWALWTRNVLFALLIGLSYFSLSIYALKKPSDVSLTINPRGIRINKTLYDFDSIRSFWIFYEPPHTRELSLRSRKTFVPYIKIPLGEQNPVEVRNFLIKYLPEKKHVESLIDNLAKSLRF